MSASSLNTIAATALSLTDYRALFERIVASGEPYGPPGGGYGADYTKLNLARARRIGKTLKVLPEVRTAMEGVVPQTWLVITEPWCGDSAQNLPVLEALAALAPAITLRIALRDSTDVIDRFLTNGTRSIPKLVAFDPATEKVLFTWGPRPQAAHDLVMGNKSLPEAGQLSKEALAEALHRWYHENSGAEVQREVAALVGNAR
ncbi:MAG: thioredoxin family protein [Flavobacteriales bacterium]|nr:thioredoxin family protein [Flavobacteriales bacterium]